MSSIPQAPQFERHLEFGKRRLPLDTAKSIQVHPRSLFGKHDYELTIRFDTLRGGKPFGWGDFHLSVDTLEETEALVTELRGHNLKWNMWLKAVAPSLQNRTIDLIFDPVSWAGTHQGKSLNWGDLYLLFQRSLGLASPDYEASVVKIDDQNSAVRLSFKEGVDLKAKMEAALLRLDRVSENHQIAKFLKGNPDFKIGSDEDEKKEERSAYDQSFQAVSNTVAAPTETSNFLSPIFDVTEDTITSRNRFFGGGKGEWEERDIPYLIKGHTHAPQESEEEPLTPSEIDVDPLAASVAQLGLQERPLTPSIEAPQQEPLQQTGTEPVSDEDSIV